MLAPHFAGIVTFIYGADAPLYMFVYTGTIASDEIVENDEGVMAWIPREKLFDLNLWAGDVKFLEPLLLGQTPFDIKVVYDEKGRLIESQTWK